MFFPKQNPVIPGSQYFSRNGPAKNPRSEMNSMFRFLQI